MIDGGAILFLIGLIGLFACSSPAEKAMTRLHYRREHVASPPIQRAFRVPPPAPALEEIAARAEAALDADDLTRGVRDVASVYERAAAQRR